MKIARHEDRGEIFLSLQGEGKTSGRPSVFVRTSLCNLHCLWCDTDYTWNWVGTPFVHNRDAEPGYRKYRQADEIVEMTPADVAGAVSQFDCRNVVFTGGEPMLQQADLIAVMERLSAMHPGFRFEVETNGTIEPFARFDELIDQYNVSPKTSNSGNAVHIRRKARPLAFFAASPKATFKFVVAGAEDLTEIRELADAFELPADSIYLMPEGTDSGTLRARQAWLIAECEQHGYRFTDRLHIHQFGGGRGV